jgi:Flp pilus assembly protein TadD
MTRKGRWLGPWAVAVGAVLLGGCRHAGPPPGNALLADRGGERAQLGPKQTADVQIAYARSLEKRGEHEQAVARYQEAVKQDPGRADAWHRLAVLHDRQGKFDDSAGMYRKALELQPGDPDLYCDMGYSLYLQQRWAEAEMNLRQALALRPDHARARNNLALLLARAGRADEALAESRRAGCSEADAHVNVAFALALQGSCPEAREHYRLALASDPSSGPARKGLEKLEAVMAKTSGTPPAEPVPAGAGVVPVSHEEAAPPASPPGSP